MGSEAAAITERGVYKIIAVIVASYLRESAGIRIVEERQIRWRELSKNRGQISQAMLKRWLVDSDNHQ
jgi:hypothetical protein